MKKIYKNLLIGAGVVGGLTAIVVAYNYISPNPDKTPTVTDQKPNKWLDDYINKNESILDDGSGSDLNFGHNTLEQSLLADKVTHKLESADYTVDRIKKTFNYEENIESNAIYIKNFIDIYAKWDKSDISAYKSTEYKESGDNSFKRNVAFIMSDGGPLPSLRKLTGWAGKYSSSKDKSTNAVPFSFNQPQTDLVPKEFVNSLKTADKEVLKANIKSNKKSSEFNTKLDNGSLNNFESLKLMLGNVDLSPSQALEDISSAFSLISAMRKRYLMDYLMNKSYEVNWWGISYGHEDLIQSISIDKSILKDSQSVLIGSNYFSKTVLGSLRSSGGILTEKTESTAIAGGKGQMSQVFAMSIRYTKMKYGLMTKYDELMINDPSLEKLIQDKIFFIFSDNDWNVGAISDYELNWFKKHKFHYEKMDNGHRSLHDVTKARIMMNISDSEFNGLAKYILK